MRTHQKPITFLAMLMALIFSATLLTGIGNQYQSTSAQAKGDKATLLQEGSMTEKQREHSKLYQEYKTGKKLTELVAEIGDVRIRRNSPLSGGDLAGSIAEPEEELRKMICEADAVIIGTPKNKSSQLSESQDFVFTDYELTVSEVLKDNAASHIQRHTIITVTRPGGTMLLRGRTVEALDDSFEPLNLEGTYLLFLRFIAVTGGYKAADSKSSFQLQGEAIKKLTKEPLSLDNELRDRGVKLFLNKIRTSSGTGCAKRSGETRNEPSV